jgi:hypothetical protein
MLINGTTTEEVGRAWLAAMHDGDFEAAWRATDRLELSRRIAEAEGRDAWQPHHLLWNGTPFAGREVRVRCNHGLGDTVQFIRFVPAIVASGAKVTVLVQPALLPLFAGDQRFGDVRNGWTEEAPPPCDIEIEVMELAYAFRATQETLPRDVPYLPLSSLVAGRAALPSWPPEEGLRVGLVWAASDWDRTRSVPLQSLAPLGSVAGPSFYSLQQGSEREARRDAPFELRPLSEHTEDVTAAAAAIMALDLVISVDAMLAHLAGALGRPTWLLLQRECDWRWMRGRSDTPWYPTMRLFRQRVHGDWSAPVAAMVRALRRFAAGRSPAGPRRSVTPPESGPSRSGAGPGATRDRWRRR